MKQTWLFAAPSFASLLAGCGQADPTPAPPQMASVDRLDAELRAQFEAELENLRQRHRIPGMSVAVVRDQEVVYARGFGYADLEREIPATEDTPYNIASCTKPIAATVLMQLVEAGQLDLDVPMAHVLKDTVFPFRSLGQEIRGYAAFCRGVKEIAHDTASPLSPAFSALYGDYRCDVGRITVRHHLTHTSEGVPGESYRYSGDLYMLLTYVAERVAAKSFADLLVDSIVRPLDMTQTVPSISAAHRDWAMADLAQYYRAHDGDFVLSQYPPEETLEALQAAGMDEFFPQVAEGQRVLLPLSAAAGMISLVLDLAKFDVAVDDNVLVSEVTKEAIWTPSRSNSGEPLPYGLGWFVQSVEGTRLIWHHGHAPGAYSSLILKVPSDNLTFILLANSDGRSAGFNLGRAPNADSVLKSPFALAFLDLFTTLEFE